MDLEEAFRKSLFPGGVHSYVVWLCLRTDYNMWPPFTWLLLYFIRWWQEAVPVLRRGVSRMCVCCFLLRNVKNEFHRLMHPRAVLPVKMNRMAVSQRTLATVMTFVFFYFVCIFFMLAGADVHGHRTGRIFRTICIKYR